MQETDTRSCIMSGLPAYSVQEIDTGTVHVLSCTLVYIPDLVSTTFNIFERKELSTLLVIVLFYMSGSDGLSGRLFKSSQYYP